MFVCIVITVFFVSFLHHKYVKYKKESGNTQFINTQYTQFIEAMTTKWSDYIPLIRDLCTDLDLFNPETFDGGHPVFMALDRTSWKMTKDDAIYVDNVIGYYREHLIWRKALAEKSR